MNDCAFYTVMFDHDSIMMMMFVTDDIKDFKQEARARSLAAKAATTG
jgi:hypothetical protein